MNETKENESKPKNKYDSANFISKFFYWWLRDIFKIGYQRPFVEDDLYECAKSHKSVKVLERFGTLWDEELKKSKPSLFRVMFKAELYKVVLVGILFSVIEIPCKILSPLLLGYLVSYFTSNPNEFDEQQAYLIATGLAVSLILTVIIFHPCMMFYCQSCIRVKSACCSLICKKISQLSKFSMKDGISGQAINLLSNDVSRLDFMIFFINNVWNAPIGSFIAGFMIYFQIGYSGLFGLLILLLSMPIYSWLGTLSSKVITKSAIQTDSRVRFMLSILKGIQTVKMYAWEISFGILLRTIRTREMDAIMKNANIKATRLSFQVTTDIAIFASLVSYVMMGNEITAQKAFVTIGYFNYINQVFVLYWPLAIASVLEGISSAVVRIEDFLVYDKSGNEMIDREQKSDEIGINLQNASAVWNVEGVNSVAISSVNLKIRDKSCLTAIIGQVGCGKSSLLEVILGEVPLTEGSIKVSGKISYAPQQPWIFEGTIRENILFTETYNARRYREVIEACALERDFELFSQGDQTLVGDRGVSLSGGQKARINIARAVYRDADIYLLDDPLSAVDVKVGKHIFNQCIQTFLRNKIVLLVTHQIQHLQGVEMILVMQQGEVKSCGNFEHVMSSSETAEFFKNSKENEVDNISSEKLDDQPSNLENSTKSEKNVESQEKGKVSNSVYKTYFLASESIAFILFVGFFLIGTQVMYSLLNYFVSIWVNWEETREIRIWIDSDWWTTEKFVYVYSAGTGILMAFMIAGAFAFYRICIRISIKLHERLYNGVIRATMYFFNTNSCGRVLNRFSKDLGLVDTQLPTVVIDCLRFFLQLFGIVVIVSIVNYWLLIPTFVMLIIFISLRSLFLKTSRNIKRVEAITRSPVFAHTTSLLQGLTTVRAFQAENDMMRQFYKLQDRNSSALFLFFASSRAFAFYIDFTSSLYITSIIFSFLAIGTDTIGSNVGLAITQSINLIGMCNWGLRQTAELENQMTSVERIFEYIELESEKALETAPQVMKSLPSTWAKKGSIEFKNVFVKYSKQGDFVLRNINFSVQSGEKIGIVGRTGAGKTSLTQAIFELAVVEGDIKIDNIETKTLGLHTFRKIISIVPQDPILFVGTLRNNLDPLNEKSDDEIWNALEQVEMKEIVRCSSDGIDTMISEDGSNFSTGQRQLFCLARAILKENKILILDEATANIDFETDQLIQNTIRNKFSSCTVLIIAHRLNTIIDCDKIMVLDAGEILEFDEPLKLLEVEDGYFSKLIKEAGIDVDKLQNRKNQ